MPVMRPQAQNGRSQGKAANLSRRREVEPVIEMQRCCVRSDKFREARNGRRLYDGRW